MRFEVKLGSEIIGFSELERGDPPMGVASGRFVPTPAYASIQSYCIKIHLNGVTSPLYGELFRHHVEAYKKQFG